MKNLRCVALSGCALGFLVVATPQGLAEQASPLTQPCAFLPETLVRSAFPIPASTPLQRTEKRACRWEYAGKAGAASASGPFVQGVALNFYTGKYTPTRIDTLFDRMKNGSSNTVNGRKIVIQPKNVEWVEGVGDKAFWNDDLSQLAISAKQHLFYVTVTATGMTKAQRIEATKKVAAAIISKL